jgi:hypothetical protein
MYPGRFPVFMRPEGPTAPGRVNSLRRRVLLIFYNACIFYYNYPISMSIKKSNYIYLFVFLQLYKTTYNFLPA